MGVVVGVSEERAGVPVRSTRIGEVGYPVFGPYILKTTGVYQVDFEIACEEAQDIAPDSACATLEITTDWGELKLAERPVLLGELDSKEFRKFSLLVATYHIHLLEFRVKAHGNAALVIRNAPEWRRVAGVMDVAPAAELGEPAQYAVETRQILRGLRPRMLCSHSTIRLGKDFDGGYVCVDDIAGIDTAFSFGICDDISWDTAIADRGLTVYQFDHTVADPAPDDDRMIFIPKMIAPHSSDSTQSLSDLIDAHDRGFEKPNLILKMDIEGGEWGVLDATPDAALGRLAWITCELHSFQNLADPGYRAVIARCLEKLGRHFDVIHVHSNVWGGYSAHANVVVPNVIEVTFVNRAAYRTADGIQTFPTALDQTCDPELPDFWLGQFAY